MATAKKKQEERASELGGDSDNDDDLENLRDSDSSDIRAGDVDMSPPPPLVISQFYPWLLPVNSQYASSLRLTTIVHYQLSIYR